MVQLKPVYEHEVALEGTAAVGEDAAAAVRARLAAILTVFADNPASVIEHVKCQSVVQSVNDRGDMVLKRELVAGNVVFRDTVTVTEDCVTFAVPAQGELRASTFDIFIEGGAGADVVFRFHYEEDADAHYPEQIQLLRNKAWRAKDQDLAVWCVRQLRDVTIN